MFMAQQTRYTHMSEFQSKNCMNIFQVIKSPRDASMKPEGDRHQNGLKIDSTDVQVYSLYYTYVPNGVCKVINT